MLFRSARIATPLPIRKPAFLPIRDISKEAGIVAQATPMIMIASGSVAQLGSGAIRAPTIPPSNTRIGVAVCPKLCAAASTKTVRYGLRFNSFNNRRTSGHYAQVQARRESGNNKNPISTDSSRQSSMTGWPDSSIIINQ